jgi:hypothetical protein
MFCRALNEYKKALGPYHSLTLNTVGILDNLFTDQGKLKEAQHISGGRCSCDWRSPSVLSVLDEQP